RAFLAGKAARFLCVCPGGVGAAFARTLQLESPAATVCVVDVPVEHPRAAEWVAAETAAAAGYVEARYDGDGRRWERVARLLPLADESVDLPLGPDDVLLV